MSYWLTLAGMGLVTYATRLSMIALGGGGRGVWAAVHGRLPRTVGYPNPPATGNHVPIRGIDPAGARA